MKVLIVGKGVVGDATGYALEQRGHDVVYHDPPKGIEETPVGCDVALLCVPTPMGALGYNSRSILYRCGDWLQSQGYTGLVGIRSTVIPGTCDELQAEFLQMTWFSWPEFLQADRAREMASNPPYTVVGLCRLASGSEVETVTSSGFRRTCCTARGAEFIKYATNAILAATVGVANELAEWADALGLDYNALVPPICKMDTVLPSNVERSPETGFGGACLPKDLAALLFHAARDHGVSLPVLSAVHEANRARRPECYERVVTRANVKPYDPGNPDDYPSDAAASGWSRVQTTNDAYQVSAGDVIGLQHKAQRCDCGTFTGQVTPVSGGEGGVALKPSWGGDAQ